MASNLTSLNSKTVEEVLFQQLQLDQETEFFVAYSGGVDSTVLVHLMYELQTCYKTEDKQLSLTVLHVDHGLQSESTKWAQHCQSWCEVLGLDYRQTKLHMAEKAQHSEQQARQARYNWFTEQMPNNAVLLTAHHQQDKAETLLFNLMRGAGVRGLSSMRVSRNLDKQKQTRLIRPLLAVNQQTIEHYANTHKLPWVDDPSNEQVDYSRNYIRHKIVPELTKFRDDAVQNVVRCAENLQVESELLDEIAQHDVTQITQKPFHPIDSSHAICIPELNELTPARRSNVFRYWLATINAPLPDQRLMQELEAAFLKPPESSAILQQTAWQYRFYQNYCYVMPALNTEKGEVSKTQESITWANNQSTLDLEVQKIRLTMKAELKAKLKAQLNESKEATLEIRFRKQGDILTDSSGKTINLKKWMQENDIPPWRRFSLPMLFLRQEKGMVWLGVLDSQHESQWCSFDLLNFNQVD